MDSYQAVYDAVCSKIGRCNTADIVQEAVRGMDISFYADMCRQSVVQACSEYERPCAVFKPKIYPDGDMWCALYGDNLQEGVAGFGKSPSEAMYDFDNNWRKSLDFAQ